VDVGANIGYYTVLLADKVGKNGKVYAFEPDIINFEILEKNIKANNLENVVAINVAVGSKNETKILYKSEENLGDHKLYNDQFLMSNVQKTKIIKLDEYLINQKVDLLKIDTQGWEPAVIEGTKKTIEKYKPIIFFEYSPASYKQANLDGDKMMDFIKKIYKKIWWIDEWVYIYKSLDKKGIDKICKSNKTGYADLWVKKEISFNDKIGQVRDLRIKKLIKKLII